MPEHGVLLAAADFVPAPEHALISHLGTGQAAGLRSHRRQPERQTSVGMLTGPRPPSPSMSRYGRQPA